MCFWTRASIAEAFLRMTLLLLLTKFYHIFKEFDFFESLVETYPKWILFWALHKNELIYFTLYHICQNSQKIYWNFCNILRFSKNRLISPYIDSVVGLDSISGLFFINWIFSVIIDACQSLTILINSWQLLSIPIYCQF